MQIAILNSNRAQAEWMRAALAPLRHHCAVLPNAAALLEQLEDARCDLLVLDRDTMDSTGDILHAARNRRAGLPALFVASRAADAEDDVVAAMAAGINDYIVQPLRQGEFRMRVRALLRCAYPEQDATEQTRIGPYLFDHRALRVTIAGGAIDLTQKEFDLALLFFRHLGRPLSRALIRESIWVREADVPSRTVDTHVSRVRSKLRLRPENGFRLLPVYSFGYRLEQIADAPDVRKEQYSKETM